jgi:hypothetical protein
MLGANGRVQQVSIDGGAVALDDSNRIRTGLLNFWAVDMVLERDQIRAISGGIAHHAAIAGNEREASIE